jgi:hypothetical protein
MKVDANLFNSFRESDASNPLHPYPLFPNPLLPYPLSSGLVRLDFNFFYSKIP